MLFIKWVGQIYRGRKYFRNFKLKLIKIIHYIHKRYRHDPTNLTDDVSVTHVVPSTLTPTYETPRSPRLSSVLIVDFIMFV